MASLLLRALFKIPPSFYAAPAYYKGVRMKASEALQRAALKPLQPFATDDNALTSSNAYATAQATFLVHDAKAALEWADLIYAIDLNGMNSSITPLSLPVQAKRPFPWLNWHAGRILGIVGTLMFVGSVLFGLFFLAHMMIRRRRYV